MSGEASKTLQSSYWIKTAVFFVILFGFGLLPAPDPLTSYGMHALAIFFAMLFGWSTIGMIWPSIAGMLAMAAFGILPINDVFANGFGSSTMLLIFFMMMVAKNLEKAGISRLIALWFISRKVVIGRPWLFAFVFLIAISIVTSLTSAVAMIFLGWVIFQDILHEIKAEKFEPFANYLMIGIVLAACLGDGLFSFRTVGAVAWVVCEKVSGGVLNTAMYTAWSLSLCVILLGLYSLMGKFVFHIDASRLKSLDEAYFAQQSLHMNVRQKAIMALMVLLIFCMLGPSVTPAAWSINKLLGSIGSGGIAAFIVLLMCVIQIQGQPLMEPASIIREGVNFNVIFLGAAILPMAMKVFSSEEAGITDFLVKVLSPLVNGRSGMAFLIVSMLCAVVLTNLLINLTVPTMLFPAFYPLAQGVGIDPVVLMGCLVYGCFLAYLLPCASPMAAVMFGNKEWIRPKDIVKYAGCFILIAIVVLCIYGIPAANVMLG